MSLPDTSVKYFDSTMVGAPTLSGTAGALIDVLDACLVNGFGTVTLDSLVIAENVATASVSTGHGFAMIGNTGPVIKISGATPAGLNGDWRIASVPNSTSFTFAVEGVANSSASGTITAKRAPAGWAKPFNDSTKAVYARTAIEATDMVLRVDDSTAYSAGVIAYESMSDIDTGITPNPLSSNVGMLRSPANNSTPINWILAADGLLFFHHVVVSENSYFTAQAFGDFIPLLETPDGYCCVLAPGVGGPGGTQFSYGGQNSPLFGANFFPNIRLSRSYTQLGTAINGALFSSGMSSFGYNSGYTYPDPISLSAVLGTIHIKESYFIRGVFPGIFCPLNHFTDSSYHKTILAGSGPLSGREMMILGGMNNKGAIVLDITGPWR